MPEMRVIVPDEHYQIVNFQQDEMPGVAVLNRALIEFEPKIVFRWHLSVWLELTDLTDNGMPSQAQRDLVDPFGDLLDGLLKGPVHDKPNALFLGRITWNASRELIYRVFDPEPANASIQSIIGGAEHPCEFNFRMEDDPEWSLADWHLRVARPNKPMQADRQQR